MRPSPVRSNVEPLSLEESVSLHAPVLIRRTDHRVPEPHGEAAARNKSEIFPATVVALSGRSGLQVLDFRDVMCDRFKLGMGLGLGLGLGRALSTDPNFYMRILGELTLFHRN